jgi:hypothetical protein
MGWLSLLNKHSYGYFQNVWGTPIETGKPLPDVHCFNPDDRAHLLLIAKGDPELDGDAKEGRNLKKSGSTVRFVIISE